MLITTTAELKVYLPVEKAMVNQSFSPYIEQAEDNYIAPILGDALLATLRANYAANTLTADQVKLLDQVRKVIAPIAFYLYTPILNVRITEGGLVTSETQTTQRAAKWMVDGMRLQLLSTGYKAIDNLFKYLEKNTAADFYASWKAGTGYSQYNRFFIRNADEMTRGGAPIHGSRWLYTRMESIIDSVEIRFIEGEISPGLFAALKARAAAGTLSADDRILIGYIQKPLACHAYSEALKDASFRQEQFVVNVTPTEAIKEVDLGIQQFSSIIKEYREQGDMFIDRLRTYLNQTSSAILFPEYFSSSLYRSPGVDSGGSLYENDSSSGTFFMM